MAQATTSERDDREINYTLRLMAMEDLDGVLDIENVSFPTPWSRFSFASELLDNNFSRYVVCQEEGLNKIIGYAGMWLILDEAHITNVAVHPDYRGYRLGEALLLKLIALALAHGATKMTLEVRLSNMGAQRLYRRMGFVAAGKRKGYYSDNNEDALIMWKELI